MSASIENIDSWSKSDSVNLARSKNVRRNALVTFSPKSLVHLPLKPLTAIRDRNFGKVTCGGVSSFLIKLVVLEAVRRFSRSRCPFVWSGLQALQVLCYPPFKWIQRWSPFGFVVKGMQVLSRPLLVLSAVNAFSELSDCSNSSLDDSDNSDSETDSQLNTESHSGSQCLPSNQITGTSNGNHQTVQPTSWMSHLSEELTNLRIALPERITKGELQRFYVAANGDLRSFLSSVKKTIHWRESYRFLSFEELDMWSNSIFWHGLDVKNRPCLIIRLGVVCTSLRSQDRPRFAQAVVSQVEHGVLKLVDGEDPQITVLVDCFGLSPMRFPMKMLRHCCDLLEDHYPNVLGCLIVIRLPPIIRVVSRTFIQLLKPVTKKKLRIEGDSYKRALLVFFQTVPSYLGGQCTCSVCSELETGRKPEISDNFHRIIGTSNAGRDSADAKDCPEEQSSHTTVESSNPSKWLRSAVIGVVIIWVLIAFIKGLYNLEGLSVLSI